MPQLEDAIALEVNGEAVDLEEVLRSAKWRSQLGFIQDAIDAVLIRQAAAQHRIEVSDEELQQAADAFRASRGLHEAKATEDWLKGNHLTFDDWEALLEGEVLTRKLGDALTRAKVEQHFAENRLSYDRATLSQIVMGDEDVARELYAQIAEEGEDFHALARQYSADGSTRLAGGYMGAVGRKAMDAALEAAVFGAREGAVVGPFKTDEGWRLVKVEALHPATLDETTREAIQSTLYEEWLSEQRRRARIRTPLLDPTPDETFAPMG